MKNIIFLIAILIVTGCIFQPDEKLTLKNPLDPNSNTYEETSVSDLNIESGQKFYTSEITITWKGSTYAFEYQCVLGDSAYAWNTSSWIKFTDLTPGEYLFKVTPRNKAGFLGKTVDRLFTIFESPVVDSLSFQNGQTFTISNVDISWKGNTTATSYRHILNDQPGEWSDATKASFKDLEDGVYNLTITARNDDFTGSPQTWTFIVDTSAARLTISGMVTYADEVTILLEGDVSEARITGIDDTYSFKVREGGNYTLTPQKPGYTFNPESVNLNKITTDIIQNFSATLNRYTISGTVTGADSVTVQLAGGADESVMVDNGGSYSFTVNALGSYVIAVSHIGYKFTPNIKMFPSLLDNVVQDFRAIQDTYTITGTITGANGVIVHLSGDTEKSVTVNDKGSYLFTVASLGTYTVSVEKEGYDFILDSRTFQNIIENQVQDFVASQRVLSITGTVTGADNVTVLLGGDVSEARITGNNGIYSFKVKDNGSYTLTPQKQGYTFDPKSVNLNKITTDIIQNFSATLNHYTISGTVTGADGVVVQLSGDADESVTVNDGETYSFTVNALGDYAIIPYKSGYSIYPGNSIFVSLTQNISQDFLAQRADALTISGLIKGLDGVTVRLSGDLEGTQLVDNGDRYEFLVNKGGTYTVSLFKESCMFDVYRITFENVTRIQIQNFTGQVIPDNDRNKFLYYMSGWGSLSEINVMLEAMPFIYTVRDKDGKTPLHLATYYRQIESMQLLLEKGADIEAKDNGGKTPLHLAASYEGNTEIVQLLLDRGADIEAKDNYGETPLYEVVRGGNTETAQLLLDRGADIKAINNNGETPLHLAANSQTEVALLLLNRGADIEIKDNEGRTPLHNAAYQGITEIVQLLLDRGADINAKDDYGDTPLHEVARGWGILTETVRLLLDRGANIEAKNNHGETPLHFATFSSIEVVQLLLDRGADIEAKDENELTPLLYATYRSSNKEIVQLLLDRGADINIKDKSGWTPLHFASINWVEIVQLLLDRGVYIDPKTSSGQTPLHLAAQVGQNEIVQLLLDRGANVNAINIDNNLNKKCTPLDYAEDNSHTETTEILRAAGGKRFSEL